MKHVPPNMFCYFFRSLLSLARRLCFPTQRHSRETYLFVSSTRFCHFFFFLLLQLQRPAHLRSACTFHPENPHQHEINKTHHEAITTVGGMQRREERRREEERKEEKRGEVLQQMVRLLQTRINHRQETSFLPSLTIISSCSTATHSCTPSPEGKAASRYESKHRACVSLCVSLSLCVSVTQRESSSHLCLSAAPASLTDEARNDSSALHSASLSLPHNTSSHSSLLSSAAHQKHTLKLFFPYHALSPLWLAGTQHHRGQRMMQYSSLRSPSLSTSRPSALSLNPN